MDGRETLEARFLGRDKLVFEMWYYCCAYIVYIVHVASVMLCACGVVYTYSVYMLLCNVMYRVVQIVLFEYFICSVGHRWCYVHVGYVMLYAYGVVRMLDMQCCV